MLPTVKTTMIGAVTALSLALTSAAPAHALGKNEQKFLQGAAAALIISEIVKDARSRRVAAPVYAQPQYVQPQYVQPRPVYASTGYQSTSIYRTPAAQAFNSYGYNDRKAIQRTLARSGYYRSGIDGSFGPGTYNAIASYARDTGNNQSLQSREGAFGLYDSLIY